MKKKKIRKFARKLLRALAAYESATVGGRPAEVQKLTWRRVWNLHQKIAPRLGVL